MMNYEEFIDKIKERAGQQFGAENVRIESITKTNVNNGKALIVSEGDANIFPTIYLKEFYDLLESGESFDTVYDDIIEQYERFKVTTPFDAECFKDFSRIKGKIVLRLINTEKNTELLKTAPNRGFLNLSIIYGVFFGVNSEGTSAWSMVKNEHMKTWGVDEGTLYNLAVQNTPRLLSPIFKSLPEFLSEMMDVDFLNNDTSEEDMLYIATNSERAHGSALMLYPNIWEAYLKQLNTDTLVVLPSSLHEVMVLKGKEESCSDLQELVKEINSTTVAESDYLSDSVYVYNNGRMQIAVA